MTRRFIGFGAKDIEARAQSNPEDIPDLIEELTHRKSAGARRLLEKLKRTGGKAPPRAPNQSDLFDAGSIQDGGKGESSAYPQMRRRERPFNWKKLNGFPPTDEQEQAVDHFIKGDSMKISAFAGTGKTSTLRFLAATAPKERGLYLAFNRSIAKEAKGVFTAKTDCRTTHSAALTDLRPRYAQSACPAPRHSTEGCPFKKEWRPGGKAFAAADGGQQKAGNDASRLRRDEVRSDRRTKQAHRRTAYPEHTAPA